jgi:hypothetical protein
VGLSVVRLHRGASHHFSRLPPAALVFSPPLRHRPLPLWQRSLSRPLPPFLTRLLGSSYRNRNGPDGFHPPGLPVARADRPTQLQCRPEARSSCRALITVRLATQIHPIATRTPPLPFLLPFTPRALSLPPPLSCAATGRPPTPYARRLGLVGPLPATSTHQVCAPFLFHSCCVKPSTRTLI